LVIIVKPVCRGCEIELYDFYHHPEL